MFAQQFKKIALHDYDKTDYRVVIRWRFARKRTIIYGTYSPSYENINENWTAATSLSVVYSCARISDTREEICNAANYPNSL